MWTTRRGRLTVYLGAAPGRRQDLRDARRGAPAAASAAPTWSSATSRRTAASRPRPSSRGSRWCRARTVDYRGATFTEMDTDAIIARRPGRRAASTSSPTPTCRAAGTRSGPRTSSELLAAGIDVITTVNIQHLESLNDEVERITGVRQRETVPDEVVRDRRPDPARRHVARGAAPADGARQHLQGREDRRLAHVVLPGRQPHRAARARPAVAGRPGRRRSSTTTAARTRSRSPGRPRSGSSSRSPAAPRARRCSGAGARLAQRAAGSELLAVHVIATDGLRHHRRAPDRPGPAAGRRASAAPSTPSSARTSRPPWSTSPPAPTPP